jgi:hypothetical protein
MPSPKILPHLHNRASRRASGLATPQGGERGRRRLRAALAAAALLFALFAVYPLLVRTASHDIAGDSHTVTDCDRLAAHPADTQKLAPGVSAAAMNITAARTACLRAVARAPHDGRLLYQLSRPYLIAGAYEPGLDYLRRSADAGYAQGQFARALMLLRGEGQPADTCGAGRTLLAAARQQHFYARIYLAHLWQQGQFAACHLAVADAEIGAMLDGAHDLAATADQRRELHAAQAAWRAHHGRPGPT